MNIGSALYVGVQHKRMITVRYLFCILIAMIMLSSCTGLSSTSDFAPPSDNTGEPVATMTPLLPTATVTPAATVTATPFVSVSEGEALPDDLVAISAKNIKKLQEIGRWGNGVAYDMVWSPDGKFIAISTSRYLLLIDVELLEITRRIDTGFPLYRIAFSSDSSKIYGGGTQGKLLTYDIAADTQEPINLGNVLPVTALAASHMGKYVAVANWDRSIHLWDLENNQLMKSFATSISGNKALGFSADDEVLFGWSPIESITGWHILTAQQPETYFFGLDANQQTGSAVRISADGTAAAVNQTWIMRVQNLSDGTTIGVLKDFNYKVEDLAVTADGEQTISLHRDMVRLWQNDKSKMIGTYDLSELADQNPVAIRVSPDGSRFVLLGQDLIFFEIDTETNEIIQSDILPLRLATDLSFAAQRGPEDVLYQMGLDGVLYEMSLQNGDQAQSVISSANQISAYAVSDSVFVVGFSNYTIEIYDPKTWKVQQTLRGLSKIPVVLLISEPQNVLVAQTDKNTTGIWELSTGNYLSKQEWGVALDDLQLSYDQQYLLGSGDGQTQIYDLKGDSMSEVLNGRLLDDNQSGLLLQRYGRDASLVLLNPETLQPITQLNSTPCDAGVLSPDGQLLALSGKELIIWDMEKSEIVLQMENPARGAELFFSSDGRLLIFVYADGSKLLYGIPN